MGTPDAINRRYGRGIAGMGATSWQASPAWASRQDCCPAASPPHWQIFPAPRADRAPAGLTQAAQLASISSAPCRSGHP
ncbi:DUF4113 domain-containing protein [Xanthomonas citri]|nr:DUF4113 domain-containing protein [Xanthomonas citri]